MPRPSPIRAGLALVAFLAAVAGAQAAQAADAAAPAAKAAYARERADCQAGRTAEDKATCLKEAGAATDERKRNRLDNTGSARQNAVERCNALAAKDKTDCLARIEGPSTSNQKTTTSGSVAGGGVIRETTTTTTGPTIIIIPNTPKPTNTPH